MRLSCLSTRFLSSIHTFNLPVLYLCKLPGGPFFLCPHQIVILIQTVGTDLACIDVAKLRGSRVIDRTDYACFAFSGINMFPQATWVWLLLSEKSDFGFLNAQSLHWIEYILFMFLLASSSCTSLWIWIILIRFQVTSSSRFQCPFNLCHLIFCDSGSKPCQWSK